MIVHTLYEGAARIARRLREDAAGHPIRVFFESRPKHGVESHGTWWATCPAWGDHYEFIHGYTRNYQAAEVEVYARATWPASMVTVERPDPV